MLGANLERIQPEAAASGLPITDVYRDFFDRLELGPDYWPTSPAWRIEQQRLCVRDARNHPVWLRRVLPTNARIEFDAMASSPEGDLKVELWGDGVSRPAGSSYRDATGYLAILGGWKNSRHLLARLDEHAAGQPEILVDPSGRDLRARPVRSGHFYHFKLERSDGRTLRWWVDDIELLVLVDPEPLVGPGHRHFAFNDWQAPVCFDNLKITALPGG